VLRCNAQHSTAVAADVIAQRHVHPPVRLSLQTPSID
jgi:hypothetical protein